MNRFNLKTVAALVAGLVLAGASVAHAQNPVVVDTGRRVSGAGYDPWNDRVTVNTDRTRVRASAFDSDRSNADPGSLHYVNNPILDAYGRVIGYERGWQWTSNGVPHGDLT